MMRQLALELAPVVPPTFENFVPGRNAEAKALLRSLAEQGSGERFVYLWGPPGSGRTHLLKATVSRCTALNIPAAYCSSKKEHSFTWISDEVQCAAIDDVHELDDSGQIALFHLYNRLREQGRGLVAAGDAPPARLALREDLLTRLAWGLVYELHALTDAEKVEALTRHAASRGFTLAPDVCEYLLRRVQRDMPNLLAMLESLDRYSLETKRPVTVPLLRELLHESRTTNRGNR